MIQRTLKSLFNRHGKGQSLVEVALFLPIFLIILAGVVEVSSILVTQNSVHNAARVGARFGANGGQDEGIAIAALNAVTDVLKIEDGVWDVWAVRGKIAADGNSFDDWQFNHVFGLQQTTAYSDVVEADIQAEVLAKLQTDENGNKPAGIAGGIEFVGTYLIYDLESILGLNALQNLAGINSVRSLNVMNNEGTDEVVTDSCTAFPIAVYENIRSLTASTWRTDIDYPTPPPTFNSFVNNVPDVSLLQAREGYIYNIQNGPEASAKGWLAWNTCAGDAGELADALTWPGNSNNYTPGPGNCPATGEPPVPGFIEDGDPTDRSMHIGDFVTSSDGSISSSAARSTIEGHIDLGRNLRVIVYSQFNNDNGNGNSSYLISRFAIMRLISYSMNQGGGESYIAAEFIRWDDSCGQPVTQ
jgi:hypothetical protein